MGKEYITDIANTILVTSSLITSIVIVCWFVYLAHAKKNVKNPNPLMSCIAMYGYQLITATGLFAIILTLFYSEYLLFVPCWLCWWGRIFAYPLFFIGLVGWYKKDRHLFDYVLALSVPGLIVSLYHQYLQMGYSPFIPCSALPGAADCAKPAFIEYGFVTFPFMSIVLFSFCIALSLTVKKFSKN